MSDLQCPARFLLLGSPDAAAADELRHERVAAVYHATSGPGGHAASAGVAGLADALGVPHHGMAYQLSLDDVERAAPETLGVLADLADIHRGETVVVAAEAEPGRRIDVTVDADGVHVEPVPSGPPGSGAGGR